MEEERGAVGEGGIGPDDEGIVADIGERAALWRDLVGHIASHYDHEPVMLREGRDRTWTIRYRKGGRTLVTLHPRKGGFVVLVVLGKEEVAKAIAAGMGGRVREAFDSARQNHDGRWLWIRPSDASDIESIKAMLALKGRPRVR